MISVCNKQDLNSLLAKSVESDGEQLTTILQRMGISQKDSVTLSIQGDDGKTLASYQFAMPENSPIIDNNQKAIDLENMMEACLNLWEENNCLLSSLPKKSEPLTDGQMKTSHTMTLSFGRMKINIDIRECCDENGQHCYLC